MSDTEKFETSQQERNKNTSPRKFEHPWPFLMMASQDPDELYGDVKASKKILYQSLQGTDGLEYLSEERVKIKKSFDHAFVHKLSTSLLLVGRSSNECIMLVRSVLDSYASDSFSSSSASSLRHSKVKNYTARVSGASLLSDHEALIDMANQFLLRNEREANVNIALEDLEEHFRQCRLDGIPAIIVLEDFHAFAKRNRQTLIYTLLDLMHNKSLLFTIVGITDRADVDTALEKRVLSRLNAQYVFMPSVSGGSICEFLHNKLLLPEANLTAGESSSAFTSPAMKRKADSLLSPSKVQCISHNMRVSRAFGTRFNSLVREMFGQYKEVNGASAQGEPATNKPSAAHTTNQSTSSEPVVEAEGESNVDIVPKRVFVPGSMQEAIYMHASWGMDFDSFSKVALKAVTLLGLEQPFLTPTLFCSALVSVEPDSVEDTVLGLSILELHLFVAVLHLYGRKLQGSASAGSSGGGGAGAASSGGGATAGRVGDAEVTMMVSQVMKVCDMLVEMKKQKTVPEMRSVQALCNLAQKGLVVMVNHVPGRNVCPASLVSLGVDGGDDLSSITGGTLLMLSVPYTEAREVFKLRTTAEAAARYEGRPRRTLLVNERMRRAVMEPHEPVVYQIGGGSASLTGAVSLSTHQALVESYRTA